MTTGFKVPMRIADMTFEGTDYDGAEIKLRLDVSIAFYLMLQDLLASNEPFTAIKPFGDDVLIEWNLLDRNGDSIPATGDGMQSLSPAFATLILSNWVEEVVRTPDPLEGSSGNGVTSGEPLMPTGSR